MSTHFHLSEHRVAEGREQAAGGGKIFPEFHVNVKDEADTVVARVRKTLYVRLKPRHRKAQ